MKNHMLVPESSLKFIGGFEHLLHVFSKTFVLKFEMIKSSTVVIGFLPSGVCVCACAYSFTPQTFHVGYGHVTLKLGQTFFS